jgi:hypothetical protein
MVVSQKKGIVRYSIDLEKKIIKRYDTFGEQIEKISQNNFESIRNLLSNKMLANLARLRELERNSRFMTISQKNEFLALKQENSNIIRFIVKENLYR